MSLATSIGLQSKEESIMLLAATTSVHITIFFPFVLPLVDWFPFRQTRYPIREKKKTWQQIGIAQACKQQQVYWCAETRRIASSWNTNAIVFLLY